MLLTIDIGNSSTKFGVFDNDAIVKEWDVNTDKLASWNPSKETAKLPAIISSVVPAADKIIRKKLKYTKFVNAENIPAIKIKIKNKKEIGADRVVNAFAAYKIYGAPAIVIDFGTATTFDVISGKGEYLGGVIAPGMALSRDILHERTAKLPKVEIKAPKNVIGNSTVEAMRSGLLYGYVVMVEGMADRIKSDSRFTIHEPRVIATGGFAKLIAKYTKGIDVVDEGLTLKGLNLINNM